MSVECTNALKELCSILVTLNIFISENESRMPNWLRLVARKYPRALVGSGKDFDANDVKELQKKFNAAVKMQSTFGYQIRKSEAYGDSVIVVIPRETVEALKKTDATGLLEEYADASANNEMNFG